MQIKLQPGDVFASSNPQALGWVINWIQRLRSRDNESEYGHTGIVLKTDGMILEASNKIMTNNLFEEYAGTKVLVARWWGMTPAAFLKGFDAVKGSIGDIYPYYRLLLHFLRLAKFIHFKTPVCSELTQKFLINAGATTISGQNPWGINPDDLVDEWRVSKFVDIVFEGIIEKGE